MILKTSFIALDAYCLLEIFNFLNKRINELNIKFDMNLSVGKKFKGATTTTQAKLNNKISEKTKTNVSKSGTELNKNQEEDVISK